MASPKANLVSVKEGLKEEKISHTRGETPTPERPPSSSSSPGSPNSDDMCSICLGRITERCVTDSCLHGFCLLCLKEWAKQKAVCPLCKLSFSKIMYNIKGEADYKEWKVPQPERVHGAAYFQEFMDSERRRFFGYRTTPFPGASRLRSMNDFGRRGAIIPDAIPSLPPHRRARYSLRGSTMFRLSVYLNNVWVQPLADITGRYRQSSPELYREQPALTHRLVPWVNRELAALVSPSRVGMVLTEVMELIERHPINSREFQNAMQTHLGERTGHFVHEFYHFARSPYDMVGHDNAAQYVPRYGNEYVQSSSSSDDSDAVVEVDAVGNPVPSTSSTDGTRSQAAPGNVVREEILTQGGSVVISSSSSSDTSDNENLQPQQANINADSFELTSNPEPPSAMRRLLKRACNFLSTVNDGASTSRSEDPENAATGTITAKSETHSVDEDSDACLIVEEVVPKVQTPEIIELDSDGEYISAQNHDNSLSGERPVKKKKVRGKSKPSLKRTNVIPPPAFSNNDSLVDSKITQQDHSYCTENGPVNTLPSSSGAHSKTPVTSQDRSNKNGLTNDEINSDISDISLSSCADDDEVSEKSKKHVFLNAEALPRHSTVKGKCKKKPFCRGKRESIDGLHDAIQEKYRRQPRFPSENMLLVKIPRKDLKCKIKSSLTVSHLKGRSDGSNRKFSHVTKIRDISVESSNSSSGAWAPHTVSRKSNRNGFSSDSSCEPSSSRHDRDSASRYGRQMKSSSCSDDSYLEAKGSHTVNNYRKIKKASKKYKRKNRDKHRDKAKRSSKRKKHKRRSKAKKNATPSASELESAKKKRVRKSSHKRKRCSQDSDLESGASYVKYKRHTPVSLKINIASSTSSSEN